MGKASPLRWFENQYLRRHLKGRGMEIGALWRRFPVHSKAHVLYLDRAEIPDLKRQYWNVQDQIFLPDVVADAAALPVAPGKLDFLIASHVLEHLPFPLAALGSWYQALSAQGCLLIKVPDKRYTFDRNRERTPLSHLIGEYNHPQQTDWRAHYVDWVENVDHRMPPESEIAAGAQGLESGTINIHFHVWTSDEVMEIIEFTRRDWQLDWHPRVFWKACAYRKETTVLLVRGSEASEPRS